MDKIAKTHQARVNALYKSLLKNLDTAQSLELSILYARNAPQEYIDRLLNVQRYLKLAIEVMRPIVSEEEREL